MKSSRFVLFGLTAFALLGCVGLAEQKAKYYKENISPIVTVKPSRQVVQADLKIILAADIPQHFKIERGRKMVLIEIGNYRESIENTLKKTLAPQFKSVSISNNESGKGLELVVLSANYPDPVDILAYHFALMNNGKLVYEYKDKTNPVSRSMAATVDTWQDETSKLTIEMLTSNLSLMGEQVRDQLLINDKLEGFWRKLN